MDRVPVPIARSRRRAWLARAVAAGVALVPTLGLVSIAGGAVGGCPRTVFREDDKLTLNVAEAARGTTVSMIAGLQGGTDANSIDATIDVAASPDTNLIGSAPPPPGVTVSVDPAPVTDFRETTFRLTVTIAADAPLRAIYVRAGEVLGFDRESKRYHYAIRPLQVTKGAGAPGAGFPLPSSGVRGTSVDVEIPSTGVAGAVTVDPLDDWITATGTTYDAGTGRVRTTLEIAPDARTGTTYLEVVNGDGVHSEPVPFTVLAGQPQPAILDLYPNVVRSNQARFTVLGAGSGFATGMTLANSAPGVAGLGAAAVIDSRTFTVPVALPADPVLGDLLISPETVGGAGPAVRLAVVPPDATVPALNRIVPDRVVTNTSTLVRIEGANLDQRGPIDVVGIGSDAVEVPFVRAEIVPGSAPHASFAVVRLVGAPGDPVVGGTPTGTVRLALRNADGLTTSPLPLEVVPRPTAAAPFVRSVQVGRIERGGEVVERIEGERLRDVTRVYVESGGVELKRGVRIADDPSGTSITVTLVADDDAPLTGDAPTNLVVVTRGGRSNQLAFEVAPSSGGGGGCGTAATSGVQLTAVATGASGYRRDILTASSAIDRSTQSGEIRIDHCTTDFNCFGMYVRTGAADLHVGTYTAVNLLFSDGLGNSWYTVASPQVRVVAEGPHHVVFCLDNVLDGEGTNDDIRLTGYVVMSR